MRQSQFLRKLQRLIQFSEKSFIISSELNEKLGDLGFDGVYITWDVVDGILIAFEGEQWVLTDEAFEAIFNSKTRDELITKLNAQRGRTL
ncbi:hypothetical protein IRT38_00885 (plasmid) [Acinetobacter sp. SK-43]|uniref:hypothetical protein n=1 Tax=Acinetobacter sp. SK-43 TaxID=2785295 RepID=UPI00188A2028|nr:hypothetical protein [Acinetobacter sp. SK-43]MBF4453971.1 hypothetical protein [Acinetobacter sp. SK-43]